MRPVLVWDWGVRVFHVLLIGGFFAAYAIARFGGEHHPAFALHMIFGLTIAALVVARLVWGFVGTRWARWSTVLHGPGAFADNVRHLFRKGGRHFTGHNPLSTLGIAAMFVLALALAATGYAYTQGIETFEEIHPVLANLFLLVVGGHIAGVVLHQFVHGGRLVLGMVDGRKIAPEADAIPRSAPIAGLIFLGLAAWIGGGMWTHYDPAAGTTRIPGLPLSIALGESEGEGRESGGGEQEADRQEIRQSPERAQRGEGEEHERHERGEDRD